MKKPRLRAVFSYSSLMFISRILLSIVIYLGLLLPTTSSGTRQFCLP